MGFVEGEGSEADPDDVFPAIDEFRRPIQYLANLLSAGDEEVIRGVLKRLAAMRGYMREKNLAGEGYEEIAASVGMAPRAIEDMYRLLAIAKYEERYVIPLAHKELANDGLYTQRGADGLDFASSHATAADRSSDGAFYSTEDLNRTARELYEQGASSSSCSLDFEGGPGGCGSAEIGAPGGSPGGAQRNGTFYAMKEELEKKAREWGRWRHRTSSSSKARRTSNRSTSRSRRGPKQSDLQAALDPAPLPGRRGPRVPARDRRGRPWTPRLASQGRRACVPGVLGERGHDPLARRLHRDLRLQAARLPVPESHHRDGDARARGQVLVDMKETYARAGYPLDTTELPDDPPLVLEFASEVLEEGLPVLAENRAAIEVIRRSLRHDGSPYACLIDALIFFLPELNEETVREMQKLIVQGPPQESVGLEPYAADAPPGGQLGSAVFEGRKG